MDALRFAIYALAVFRASHLVAWEDGPFDLFRRLRSRLDVHYEDGEGRRTGRGFWGKLVACEYCLSMWFALAFWLLSFTGWLGDTIALILALSGVTLLIGERL